MKDILEKRNKLCESSLNLRIIKFDLKLKKDKIEYLIKEQDKAFKEYYFYREYIKAINKEKRK